MVCVCVFVCVARPQKIWSDLKKVNATWSLKSVLGLAILCKTIGEDGLYVTYCWCGREST